MVMQENVHNNITVYMVVYGTRNAEDEGIHELSNSIRLFMHNTMFVKETHCLKKIF